MADDNGRSDIRFTVEPRLVPARKAARRLHLTHAEFVGCLAALQRERFPSPCSITGNYDLKAIDAWLDMRSKITTVDSKPRMSTSEIVKARLAALGNDKA